MCPWSLSLYIYTWYNWGTRKARASSSMVPVALLVITARFVRLCKININIYLYKIIIIIIIINYDMHMLLIFLYSQYLLCLPFCSLLLSLEKPAAPILCDGPKSDIRSYITMVPFDQDHEHIALYIYKQTIKFKCLSVCNYSTLQIAPKLLAKCNNLFHTLYICR